jgi:hypothetical protein
VTANRLCFTDLALAYSLASRVITRYAVTVHDHGGLVLAPRTELRPTTAGACGVVPVSPYAIVAIETFRPARIGTTYVHVARDGLGAPRVIGVWRE